VRALGLPTLTRGPNAIPLAKTLLDSYNASYEAIEINVVDDGPELKSQLIALTGRSTVPNIFVGGENIGGSDDLQALHQQGKLKATLEKANAI